MRGARSRFRLHTADHEAPAGKRLFVLALWSALCVLVGLIPAVRLVAVMALRDTPFWYPLASVTVGVLGLGMITAAFAAIHRARLPWYLLGAATVLLIMNITLISVVR